MKLFSKGAVWNDGNYVFSNLNPDEARKAKNKTIAYKIMSAHNIGTDSDMRIKFDALISHDITYVGIIQTAKASGMKEFPLPYAMTNCHNSLCAVGGTINADDHIFGLSAAKKYGGNFVPANMAVIHQYAREMMTGCGRMILGSDSHTRYGAIGTMGFGEGGPELVKQLLSRTYDVKAPEMVLVYLKGEPRRGVGPHDVAIALCGAVYKNNFVKNKILEFAGPGVSKLSMEYRIGIDVMTTETACLSSIWETDDKTKDYLALHGRPDEYKALSPENGAYYDSVIEIDLSELECMIAMPFHPSEAYTIKELCENPRDIFAEVEERTKKQFGGKVTLDLMSKLHDGKIFCDQGIIAGCSGGMFENILEADAILRRGSIGNGYFGLSIYPPSMPVNLELVKTGIQSSLMSMGVTFKSCFCGPCFGAGDVPGNNGLSIRHTTRNFPNREGSKPSDGQISAVALMDARSIAATAANGGYLTPATEIDYEIPETPVREFDESVYKSRVYFGYGNPQKDLPLRFGPNITEWPEIAPLGENLLLELAAVIRDPVTTTDELIPSGETSSYRSNPIKLASFALSRRVPDYVERANAIAGLEAQRKSNGTSNEISSVLNSLGVVEDIANVQFGSCIFANKPGDGSAREQAASCQRVLGGCANICYEYATKRYRSNCINWGMIPFTIDAETEFPYESGAYIYIPNIRNAVINGDDSVMAKCIDENGTISDIKLNMLGLTEYDRKILLSGCLMNCYAEENA